MPKSFSILSVLMICSYLVNAQVNCVSGNCTNGFGKQVMVEGDYYEGDWVNGAREGKGVYTWADGSTYVGDFKQNVFDGVGKYTGPTGIVYEGYYTNGLFVAPFEQIDYEIAAMQKLADSLTSMVNNIPVEDDYTEYDDYEDYEDYEDISDYEIDSFVEKLNEAVQNDKDVLLAVINDFPNAFNNVKGAADFSNDFAQQFVSGTYFELAKSTFISLPIGFKYWQWVSVICEEDAFFVAEANYAYYVAIIQDLILDCCALTETTAKTIDKYNESYTTTWTVAALNEGYSGDYNSMKIIVNFYKDYNELDTYSVLVSIRDARN